jgi:hypothetical protein
MTSQTAKTNRFMKGQSLVETALFLPILIIILAGIVEVSTVLITQNRVTTAARVATGFGANHFDRSDWEGTAASMGIVALNSVTETMSMDENLWDIWSIYAKVNVDGTDFETFTASHVIGNHNVVSADEWTVREATVRADMLAELQSTGADHAQDLEVVSSVIYHDQETMLNLPVWQWTGAKTVRGLTLMRVDGPTPYAGCPLLPITVRLNQYSVYPTNWPQDAGPLNEQIYGYHDPEIFPDGIGPHDFEYPNPAPVYLNESPDPYVFTKGSEPFDRNYPGVPINDALPGYLYLARDEGPEGSFGWLCWQNCSANPNTGLKAGLTYPGNFLDPDYGYPGSPADLGTLDTNGNGSSGDGNGILEVGEWVRTSTGNIASSQDLINGYVNSGRPVTLIMYDKTNGLTGGNAAYRVSGFVITKLIGYSFQGDNKFIVFEFVDWGSACTLD